MRDVIADPSAAAKYGGSDPQHEGKLVAAILRGECPGRETIGAFYSPFGDWKQSTLNSHDIELALVAFRDTGALAKWHEANNPKLERKQPAEC